MKDPRDVIADVLSERIASNPRYSLRSFARDLRVSPQQVSNILNGRRGVSVVFAEKISKRLGLSEREQELFRELSKANYSRSKSVRAEAQARVDAIRSRPGSVRYLELDLLKMISGWHHFAILSLIKMKVDQKRFAKKLGIPENEVLLALSRLERLGLISRAPEGWGVNQSTLIADKGVPTEATRKMHQQFLEKAAWALVSQGENERYGAIATFPMRVKSVARAKKLIQEFRERFGQEIAAQGEGDEVFALNIHFFRLTEKDEERK